MGTIWIRIAGDIGRAEAEPSTKPLVLLINGMKRLVP